MNTSLLSKSYDLRGIYPTDINEEFFYRLGKAFADYIPRVNIAVGYDARVSSEVLKEAFIQGIVEQGKNVIELGLCSTDMVSFATGYYDDVDAGAMITASHNPKEYNGLKSCLKNAVPINMQKVGKELQASIDANAFKKVEKSGERTIRDAREEFINHICTFINPANIRPLKVVADAGNGVAGVFMESLAKKLHLDLVPMFFEPDGNFPNHHPSPIESKNTRDLVAKVKEEKADIGVAFDGDADRVYVCDENGEIILPSIIIAMIVKSILMKKPGSTIIYNATCSDIARETIEENGGKSLRAKVWHVYIKEMMNADPTVIFAGEHSAHYYFRDNWNADSGVIAFAYVLELLSISGKKLSELSQEFKKYANIEETNFKVSDTKVVITKLKEAFSDGEQEEFDGLTVRYPDYWFNVRPSSNEPLLRLNMEAKSQEILEQKLEEIEKFLRA